MALRNDVLLAPKGTTGNNTHTAQNLGEAGLIAAEFTVEAVGATPTVTAQMQGSLDGVNWVNLSMLTLDASVAGSTANGTWTVTAVGVTQRFVDGLDKRFYDQIRLVTSANTNVTYSARLYVQRGSRGV